MQLVRKPFVLKGKQNWKMFILELGFIQDQYKVMDYTICNKWYRASQPMAKLKHSNSIAHAVEMWSI